MKKPYVFAAIRIVCVLVAVALLAVVCLPMPNIPLFDPERGAGAAGYKTAVGLK